MTAIKTGTMSWQVNTEARVLASGWDILVRHGGLVSRCAAPGIKPFVTALLGKAAEGRIDIDPAEMDPQQLPQFEQLMTQLVAAGLFIEVDPTDEDQFSPVIFGLWQRSGGTVDRAEIAARLKTRRVCVAGSGVLADQVRMALMEAGLIIGDEQAVAAVVVGAHEQDPVLTDWNSRALNERPALPWLAVAPFDGEHATVGPWVVPGESACYECCLLRRASTFSADEMSPMLVEATAAGAVFDNSGRYPGLRLIQTGLVVDRLVEYVGLEGRGGQSMPGGLTTISVRADMIELKRHRVLRVPRCPNCSPSTGRGYPQVWFARGVGE